MKRPRVQSGYLADRPDFRPGEIKLDYLPVVSYPCVRALPPPTGSSPRRGPAPCRQSGRSRRFRCTSKSVLLRLPHPKRRQTMIRNSSPISSVIRPREPHRRRPSRGVPFRHADAGHRPAERVGQRRKETPLLDGKGPRVIGAGRRELPPAESVPDRDKIRDGRPAPDIRGRGGHAAGAGMIEDLGRFAAVASR